MERQIKEGDDALTRVFKTIPAELTSLMVMIKAFLSNDIIFIIVGLLFGVIIPFYAQKVLKIETRAQRYLILLNYIAWLLLLAQGAAENILQAILNRPTDMSIVIKLFVVCAIVLQFLVPAFLKIGPPSPAPNQP